MTSTTPFSVASIVATPVATPIADATPPVMTTALTVPTRLRVSPDQKGRYFEVHAIAEHDARLAEKLRESFDFSDVIEKGARLTHADVYKAIGDDTNAFARFETIARGISEAQDIRRGTGIVGGVIGGLGLLGAGAMVYFGMPGVLQVIIDAVVAIGGLGLTANASVALDKDADNRIAQIAHDLTKLKSLPPPATEIAAKAD